MTRSLEVLELIHKVEASIIICKTNSIMFIEESPSTFEIQHELDIYNKDQPFFNKNWNLTFPRIHN
jgi:hypothetical protein